jgi:hypothetical protein
MQKHKEGWEEANSWYTIYLVVSVGTKPPLVHVVEALIQEYCFPVTKSLPRAPLDSPLRHSPSSLDHLDAASAKELLHQGRGLNVWPTAQNIPEHFYPVPTRPAHEPYWTGVGRDLEAREFFLPFLGRARSEMLF